MKRLSILLVCGFILASCGTSVAVNNNTKVVSSYKENKSFEKSAAVNFSASVNITDSVTGSDTPTDEANEKTSKISSVVVSLFDDKSKFLDTFTLDKVDASVKGEILKFDAGFRDVQTGKITFKFAFTDSTNQVFFETQTDVDIKAKTIYKINGQVNQVSTKKDPNSETTTNVDVNEMKDDSYKQGEIIVSLKNEQTKEEDLKTELEKNGIKINELKKGILKNYTISFLSPSVAEALIIAQKTGKFEYVEPNGIVTLQF